ncbi:MAG: hypothetical protein GF334_06555 [Candidatus Altiarchaeales archaeon]|nr:hypothetical protein [Candidatus Altiarchaeales archaeon]
MDEERLRKLKELDGEDKEVLESLQRIETRRKTSPRFWHFDLAYGSDKTLVSVVRQDGTLSYFQIPLWKYRDLIKESLAPLYPEKEAEKKKVGRKGWIRNNQNWAREKENRNLFRNNMRHRDPTR